MSSDDFQQFKNRILHQNRATVRGSTLLDSSSWSISLSDDNPSSPREELTWTPTSTEIRMRTPIRDSKQSTSITSTKLKTPTSVSTNRTDQGDWTLIASPIFSRASNSSSRGSISPLSDKSSPIGYRESIQSSKNSPSVSLSTDLCTSPVSISDFSRSSTSVASDDSFRKLKSEINRKGLEIVNLHQRSMKAQKQHQREREAWMDQRRLKDSIIQQQQEEIHDHKRRMRIRVEELSHLESQIRDQQQEILSLHSDRDQHRKLCAHWKKKFEETERKLVLQDRVRVAPVVEEYQNMVRDERKKNDELRDRILELEKERREWIVERDRQEKNIAQLERVVEEAQLELQQLIDNEKQRKDSLCVVGTQTDDSIIAADSDDEKDEYISQLERLLRERDLKVRQLQQLNDQLVDDELQLQQRMTDENNKKDSEIAELKLLLDAHQHRQREMTAAAGEPNYLERHMQEDMIVQSNRELESIIKLIRSYAVMDSGSQDSNSASEAQTTNGQSLTNMGRQLQILRSQLGELRTVVTDYYADILGSSATGCTHQ